MAKFDILSFFGRKKTKNNLFFSLFARVEIFSGAHGGTSVKSPALISSQPRLKENVPHIVCVCHVDTDNFDIVGNRTDKNVGTLRIPVCSYFVEK